LQQKYIQGLKPKNGELTGTKMMIKPYFNNDSGCENSKIIGPAAFNPKAHCTKSAQL
jgi:hypothetical protein